MNVFIETQFNSQENSSGLHLGIGFFNIKNPKLLPQANEVSLGMCFCQHSHAEMQVVEVCN